MAELLDELFKVTEKNEKFYENSPEEIRAELKKEVRGLEEWSWNRGRVLPLILSREECKALMNAFTKGKIAWRNNFIIRVLYATGMKVEELERLRFQDISFDTGSVFVREGKKSRERYSFLDPETLEKLRSWMEGKDQGESVFGISSRQLRSIVKRAGEKTGISEKFKALGRRFTAHTLRHTFACHCYEEGMRLPTLQKLLGFEYLRTTMIYLYTARKNDLVEYGRSFPLSE